AEFHHRRRRDRRGSSSRRSRWRRREQSWIVLEAAGDGVLASFIEHRLPVADPAEREEWIEGGAVASSGFRDQRTHVGGVRRLDHLGGEGGVVAFLGVGERV